MKSRLAIGVTIVVCIGLIAISTLNAQRQGASPWSATGTALVDVDALTRNSPRLKQALDALKETYGAEAESLKKESQRGNELAKKLSTLRPGSPDYKQLEHDLLTMKADFELRGKRATEAIKDRESKIYYAFSRELQGEITRFAQATGVPLVLRYDPPSEERTNPRAVLREVHRLIVYQRGLEVTPSVAQAMDRRTAVKPTAKRPSPPAQPARARPVQR
jgi:Skp family chaperone for outer membrane proteins